MESLEALRRKISSAEDLRGIVRTMKTLAAVSIRQYQQAVESLAEYHRAIQMGLQVVLAAQPEAPPPGRLRTNARTLAIVFGSDQGMAGQFNEQIAAYTLGALEKADLAPERRLVLAVGERGRARLEAIGQPVAGSMAVAASAAGITPVVQRLLIRLDELRAEQTVQQVLLFYNAPAAAGSYRQRRRRLMPVDVEALRRARESAWPPRSHPIFHMDPQRLLSALLRQHLFVTAFRAMAESLAAENASRLASMQAAERNIDERLGELTMLYHQQRQSAITSELLDIVSGFEVLEG
jgi:F-type H+-transporting ATPase subunit gamma